MRKAFTLAAALAIAVTGADGQTLASAPGASGRITVSGGSTVRSWSCDVTQFQATLRTEPGSAAAVADLPEGRQRVAVVIPVAQMDCRNGTMNEHMRNALEAEDHPEIRYELTGYQVVNGAVRATGDLTIAGETKPVTMDVQVDPRSGGVRVQGETALRMTEFGVRPPRLMLGTLKVHDEITVSFDVLIGHSALALALNGAAR